MTKRVTLGLVISAALLMSLSAGVVFAKNTWSGYHWERSANPVTVSLGDNTSDAWDVFLGPVSNDWTVSGVVDTPVVPGVGCGMVAGGVQVCNGDYGQNGWLGLATIHVGSNGHILVGTAKVNDSYFATPAYDDANAKRHVLC